MFILMTSGYPRTNALLKDVNNIIFRPIPEIENGMDNSIAYNYDSPIDNSDPFQKDADHKYRTKILEDFLNKREKEVTHFTIEFGIARPLNAHQAYINYARLDSTSPLVKSKRILACKLDKSKIIEFEKASIAAFSPTKNKVFANEIAKVIAASIAAEFLTYFFSLMQYKYEGEKKHIKETYNSFNYALDMFPNLYKQFDKERHIMYKQKRFKTF